MEIIITELNSLYLYNIEEARLYSYYLILSFYKSFSGLFMRAAGNFLFSVLDLCSVCLHSSLAECLPDGSCLRCAKLECKIRLTELNKNKYYFYYRWVLAQDPHPNSLLLLPRLNIQNQPSVHHRHPIPIYSPPVLHILLLSKSSCIKDNP